MQVSDKPYRILPPFLDGFYFLIYFGGFLCFFVCFNSILVVLICQLAGNN